MSNDVAGPMLGWSLGSGVEQRRIHDLVEFPCEFCFKAVGRSDHNFVSALLERVGRVLGRSITAGEHTVRKSAQGTYESVTLNLWVTSGDEVYSIYAALGDDDRVKYLL
jgi:putative lipoic acid-binding regulatory protein